MNRNLAILGIAISLIGVIFSFTLALEYYGANTGIAQGLCSVGEDGVSGCKKVEQSSYSSLPQLPFFGKLPVALFGLGFYGLLGSLSAQWIRREESEGKDLAHTLFLFSILGILADLVLLILMIFVIGAICNLCLVTYFASFGLLIVNYLLYKSYTSHSKEALMQYWQKNFINFAIIFLGFFTAGMLIARATSPQNTRLMDSDNIESQDLDSKKQAYFARPILSLETNGYPSIGDPQSPITIVKFADFNCGHCMHASHILDRVLIDFKGMVKVVYKNFPLDGNCNPKVSFKRPGASSCIAAYASICADRMGKFNEVYHALYKDNEMGVSHTPASVENIMQKSGIPQEKYFACLKDPSVLTQLNKEIEEADKLNVQATPSVYLNSRALDSGTPNPQLLKELIQELIRKL
jgi:protein-disulfide isomerase/uncharacterized membrane protein